MVDALCRTRRWLKPDGYLVDLRPAHLVPTVEIGDPCNDYSLAGGLTVDDERRRRHAAADVALATVLKRQLFYIEEGREFSFLRYADSARELQDYIATRWQHTRLDDETRERADAMLRDQPAGRLWLRERVAIRSLRVVTSPPEAAVQ